jgi:hypothetical protein
MAGEFKVQLLETFAALITAAFGLVAALAWNETIKTAVNLLFEDIDLPETVGLLIYAILVTILAVIMTIWIARALSKAKEAMIEDEDE